MTRQAKTPAQRKRNEYAASVRTRGASGHNLWFITPPRDPIDPVLVLCSDIEHETLLFLEGQEEYVDLDYSPLRHGGGEPRRGIRQFAIATTLDGDRVAIELDPAGKAGIRSGTRTINIDVLDAATTRVQSWRSVIAVINRCRTHELNPVIFRCRNLVEARPNMTVGELLNEVDEHPALVAGAIGTMLRSRELKSDLDERLWGPETRVRRNARG